MTTLFNFNIKKKTGVIYYPEKKIIRKFSTDKNKKKLSNEFDGFNWYLKKTNFNLENKNKRLKYFKKENFINFPLIKAYKIPYWKPLSETKVYIKHLIKHYVKVWPDQKQTSYHGDLTIENVLFTQLNHPLIIDWEYFEKNRPWGLDICHLLISSIVLPAISKKQFCIPNTELELFEKYWNNFFMNKNFVYLDDPIKYLNKMNSKNYLKPKNINFISKISNHQKNQIRDVINKNGK